jgi:hypothetical protein
VEREIGRVFRIGYYRRQDGLEVIWLISAEGRYPQTTDGRFLSKYFEAVEMGDESDLYGLNNPEYGPL